MDFKAILVVNSHVYSNFTHSRPKLETTWVSIKRMTHQGTHTGQYYSEMKRDKLLTLATTRTDLKSLRSRKEVRHRVMHTPRFFSNEALMYGYRNQTVGCLWGVWRLRGTKELPGAPKMFCVLTRVVTTQCVCLSKSFDFEYWRSVHFTLCKFYLNTFFNQQEEN